MTRQRKLCNPNYQEDQKSHPIFNLPDARNCSVSKDFTQIPNQLLRNPDISGKAKAILCVLLSNKKGWHTYFTSLRKTMKEGIDALRSGIKELEEHNYLLRIKYRDKRTKQHAGSFWAYTDVPGSFDVSGDLKAGLKALDDAGMEPIIPENLDIEKPDTGNPLMASLEVANPTLRILSNKNTNLKNTNSKETNIYIPFLKKWNSHKIITHKKLTPGIRSSVKTSLSCYSQEEIFKAIENYASVIASENHFFNYKWTLRDFLKRGLDKFVDAADPLNNFRRQKTTSPSRVKSDGRPYPVGRSF